LNALATIHCILAMPPQPSNPMNPGEILQFLALLPMFALSLWATISTASTPRD